MSYCFNCGVKIEEEIRFCFNCGVKLADELMESSDAKSDEKSFAKTGIIMTNSGIIAKMLGEEKKLVDEAINDYINALKKASIHYSLLDFALDREIHPASWFTWQSQADYLKKRYNSLAKESGKPPQYLFIVGGHDVVPMPVLKNREKTVRDEDVDTDLPYSYLCVDMVKKSDGSDDLNDYLLKYENSIYNLVIFKQAPKLKVGRLPIERETTFDDFKNYLLRAASCALGGVPVSRGYAITQDSWKVPSRVVSERMYEQGLFSLAGKNSPTHFKYNELHVAPNLSTEDIVTGFNRDANFYYFNLHGSDAPQACNFYSVDHNEVGSISFLPQLIASSFKKNFFVTEACYGAKFKNYDKEYSMLLSAIYNQTILYLGSSRIAWGSETKDISCADVLCKRFIDGVLQNGESAGEALIQARVEVVKNCLNSPAIHKLIVSALEFNLFGDPALGASLPKSTHKKTVTAEPKLTLPEDFSYSVQSIYSSGESILDRVRGLVDANLQKIRDSINEHLYKHLNVEPRSLSDILSIKFHSGKEFYSFVYDQSTPDYTKIIIANTDKSGQIQSILTSK